MGTRSSTLVDEHETIFKKNPRRVVRPAGERCGGAVGLGANMAGTGQLLLPGLLRAFSADGRGWGTHLVRKQKGSASPAPCHCFPLTSSHADYTKSVIDLRPEDLVGEGGSLGDRSKSVPGLNTELVRPSECPGDGCQLEEPGVWLAVPACSPHSQLVSPLAGGGGGGHR